MNKQRLKAFTIMEVTVAMLIASIAIGITYTVYTIVAQSYGAYKIKNDKLSMMIRLNELLKNDFDNATAILKTANGMVFKSEDKLVKYELQPDFIVRTNVIIDTFKVQVKEINTSFENNPLTEVSTEEEQNRIDEIRLSILFEEKKIPYHYLKQYSSVNLIQRNSNALNRPE